MTTEFSVYAYQTQRRGRSCKALTFYRPAPPAPAPDRLGTILAPAGAGLWSHKLKVPKTPGDRFEFWVLDPAEAVLEAKAGNHGLRWRPDAGGGA